MLTNGCRGFAIGLMLLAGQSALAQTGSIPDEVIAECNAETNAADLPECLKNGAIAFGMLALARGENFYGDGASRVIEICREKNDTYRTTWICFENAAEQAVETQELIGVENIADICVAGISDADVYVRLDATYREKRDARFPNATFFGGDMYRAFRGCPQEAVAVEAEDALADALADPTAISPEGCAAYSEIEDIVVGNDADALRAIFARIESTDEPGPSDVSEITGLSSEAIDFFYVGENSDGEKENGARTVALLGAFLRESHPELLEDFFEHALDEQSSSPGDFGAQMVQALFMSIIDSAEELYRGQCQ